MRVTFIAAVVLGTTGTLCVAQSLLTPTSVVQLLVYHRDGYANRFEKCGKVVAFVSTDKSARDYSDHFEGCIGKEIPHGEYYATVETAPGSELGRVRGSMALPCVVNTSRSACVVVGPNDLFGPGPVRLRVSEANGAKGSGVIFLVNLYGGWKATVWFGENEEVSFGTPWVDVSATIVWNGKVVGAASLDLREAQDFDVVFDAKRKLVRVTPAATQRRKARP